MRLRHQRSLTHLPDDVHLFPGLGYGILDLRNFSLSEVHRSQELIRNALDLLRVQLAACIVRVCDLLEYFFDPFHELGLSAGQPGSLFLMALLRLSGPVFVVAPDVAGYVDQGLGILLESSIYRLHSRLDVGRHGPNLGRHHAHHLLDALEPCSKGLEFIHACRDTFHIRVKGLHFPLYRLDFLEQLLGSDRRSR